MKVLIFFLLISSSEQLRCISRNNYFNLSTISLNITEFKQNLSILEPIDNKTKECRVELAINYIQHLVAIIFDPNHPTSGSVTVGRPKVITTFILDSVLSSIDSVVIYTCSTKDACDRDFVLECFFRLLNQNYMQLQVQFIDILIQEKNQPIECTDNSLESTSKKCNEEVCATIIKKRGIFMILRDDDDCGRREIKSTSVTIITTASKYNDDNLDIDIFYTCIFYGCNNESTSIDVFNIVQTSYDVFNIIYGENIKYNITSIRTTVETLSTMTTTMFIPPMNSTTTIHGKEITSTTVAANPSFTTTTSNTVTQHFQILSILINISLSVLCSVVSFLSIHEQ